MNEGRWAESYEVSWQIHEASRDLLKITEQKYDAQLAAIRKQAADIERDTEGT
jgi:hypothetical protein